MGDFNLQVLTEVLLWNILFVHFSYIINNLLQLIKKWKVFWKKAWRTAVLKGSPIIPQSFQRFRTEPSSKTQGLLVGTKRYLRAKLYFKSWRAPGILLFLDQFQKLSNVNQRGGPAAGVTLSPSYAKGFSSSIDLLGSCSGKTVLESKFLQLMYEISTLLFLVAEKASRVHKHTNYIHSTVEQRRKLSAVARVTQLCRANVGTVG